VIRIEGLAKTFPGAAAPAVAALDLTIAAGETCVLIGPSGCGKTTTLRMINRLIEPSAGRVLFDGVDIARQEPAHLRRRMGYVIQQVGLFPHFTVGENIAVVPRLIGWPKDRIAARIEELLTLVGLDPARFRDRYPRQLSGGERQRVGVARALAADPQVLLMDEPFGALDPITRAAMQAEFLGILRRLAKTVVLVTHDIAEAVLLGDKIALMRAGRLVQCATPEAMLARPADDFVAEFVGADRALKRLSLLTAGEAMIAAPSGEDGIELPRTASLREALAAMLEAGTELVHVIDRAGRRIGTLGLTTLRLRARVK